MFECNEKDEDLRVKSTRADLVKATEEAERELRNRASINEDLALIQSSMRNQTENENEEEAAASGSDRKPQRTSALKATEKLAKITCKPKTAAQIDKERMKMMTPAERKEHYERIRQQVSRAPPKTNHQTRFFYSFSNSFNVQVSSLEGAVGQNERSKRHK